MGTMGQRSRYSIQGEEFPTKQALRQRVQGILWGAPCGAQVTGESLAFLCALLELHPSAARKIGAGISAIDIRQNPVYPNQRGFWLRRVDGTETDWSYLECLHPSSLDAKFRSACRAAIAPDIIRFRRASFQTSGSEGVCPITGERVTERTAHVDHAPPTFEQLVQDFLTAKQLVVSSKVVKPHHDDGEVVNHFVDHVLKEEWIAFHRQHAQLRIVSRTANLSILRTAQRKETTYDRP